MKKIIAFHGKVSLKKKYVARVKAHYKADEIVKGFYWEHGKGCAVGCTMEQSSNVHEEMEKVLGIPAELAFLEDTLFENLPNGTAKEFPLKFLQAIPVGADLSLICAKFMVWQFEDKKYGLKNIEEIKEGKELYGFCEEVVALYKRVIKGDNPSEEEFYTLYKKIDARARARAWARARARARARAWAWAGAWARAGAWDESPYHVIMADKLLELLKEAK